MKNNPESGVTLIEILIAVSLLSLLSVGMLMAMRLGFNTMDKTDSRLVRNRRVSQFARHHRERDRRVHVHRGGLPSGADRSALGSVSADRSRRACAS